VHFGIDPTLQAIADFLKDIPDKLILDIEWQMTNEPSDGLNRDLNYYCNSSKHNL